MVASVSSPTLWKVEGDYLYYYTSGSNGNNITRINYKGGKADYLADPLADNPEYRATKILDVDWNSSWYKPEFIGNYLLFSNAQSFGDRTYNYIYVVDMNNADGKLMNAEELNALNEKYEEVDDYIEELSNANLKTALQYYFRTAKESILTKTVRKPSTRARTNIIFTVNM